MMQRKSMLAFGLLLLLPAALGPQLAEAACAGCGFYETFTTDADGWSGAGWDPIGGRPDGAYVGAEQRIAGLDLDVGSADWSFDVHPLTSVHQWKFLLRSQSSSDVWIVHSRDMDAWGGTIDATLCWNDDAHCAPAIRLPPSAAGWHTYKVDIEENPATQAASAKLTIVGQEIVSTQQVGGVVPVDGYGGFQMVSFHTNFGVALDNVILESRTL